MNRRQVSKVLFGLSSAALFTGFYSWQIEPFWLEFVKKKMAITGLNPLHNHKTIMQISDLHIGNRFDWNFIIESFQKAKSYRPDYVVYTGDFVSYETSQQLKQLDEVFNHAVLGKKASIAILGNHDYGHQWSDKRLANKITSILEKKNIQVLRNESVEFNGLNIIGLDDYWGKNFDPKKIIKSHARHEANIVLCHNPDVCDLNVWGDYKGWILSGHTHGGQCKAPFLNPPLLPVKNKAYSQGEINLNDGRMLYVNRALGHLHQVRFNVRPEITLFELVNA